MTTFFCFSVHLNRVIGVEACASEAKPASHGMRRVLAAKMVFSGEVSEEIRPPHALRLCCATQINLCCLAWKGNTCFGGGKGRKWLGEVEKKEEIIVEVGKGVNDWRGRKRGKWLERWKIIGEVEKREMIREVENDWRGGKTGEMIGEVWKRGKWLERWIKGGNYCRGEKKG